MRRVFATRQRGAALMVLVAAIALAASWLLLKQLNAETGGMDAVRKVRNAEVLQKAKQALIGYIASQAAMTGENNPGAMPCPENLADFDDATWRQGVVGTTCTTTTIGRFPWRTLGLDKLVDASGEPLWYVVGPGWGIGVGTNTMINSNSVGQLTVDGVANAAIALIIAPGPAFSVPAATGCTAWSQARSTTGDPDFRNYLECENATSPADMSFVTTGPSGSFNDQVIKITAADVLPAIEAAIAHRIEREIVPQLKLVYASSTWSTNLSATNPMYPFPAPFANPSVTANFQGTAASCTGNMCRGLLPVIFTNNAGTSALCTPGGTSLCDPLFVNWASGTVEVKSVNVLGTAYVPGAIGAMLWSATVTNCTVVTTGSPQYSQLDCKANVPSLSGATTNSVIYEVRGVASNVGMALRKFDSAASLPGVTITTAPTVAMSNSGSAAMTFRGSTTAPIGSTLVSTALCGLSGTLLAGIECRQVTISVPITPLFPDHDLLNSQHATLGWFMRNEWYRLVYYVVAQGYTATSLPATTSCATGTSCLSATNVTPSNAQRAMLILAGRSINGSSRPSSTLSDYLDFGNATATGTAALPYERQSISRATNAALKSPFNDRVLIIDSN